MTPRWLDAAAPLWEAALDLIYPSRCAACDRLGEGYLCARCRDAIPPIPPPYCLRCHEPGESGPCPSCTARPPAFEVARCRGLFRGRLRQAIHALKYGHRERVADALAGLLEEVWEREPVLRGVDALIPLPIHPRRERARGFNQSDLLARSLARRLALPDLADALARPVHRRPQVGLDRDDRQANVAGVFRVERPELIAGCSLLLIDDVITTGATCSEAARSLLAAGAIQVKVLALAREPRAS